MLAFCCLVHYRPEHHHNWSNKAGISELRLEPLDGQNATEMLASLIGHVPELDPLKHEIIERTGGNPFL